MLQAAEHVANNVVEDFLLGRGQAGGDSLEQGLKWEKIIRLKMTSNSLSQSAVVFSGFLRAQSQDLGLDTAWSQAIYIYRKHRFKEKVVIKFRKFNYLEYHNKLVL